jgi:hypothetical protein
MIASLLALALTAAAPAAGSVLTVPVDGETRVNGVDIACTGVGETRLEPRWLSYGERIEFSNARNEYLSGGAVRLTDGAGRTVLEAACDAPWILVRLPKGQYRLEGWMADRPGSVRSARFSVPHHGQVRLVLQFFDQ